MSSTYYLQAHCYEIANTCLRVHLWTDTMFYTCLCTHQVGNTKRMWKKCFNIYKYLNFPEFPKFLNSQATLKILCNIFWTIRIFYILNWIVLHSQIPWPDHTISLVWLPCLIGVKQQHRHKCGKDQALASFTFCTCAWHVQTALYALSCGAVAISHDLKVFVENNHRS